MKLCSDICHNEKEIACAAGVCFNGDRRAVNSAAALGRKKIDTQETGMAKAKKSLKKSKKLESTKPLMRSLR